MTIDKTFTAYVLALVFGVTSLLFTVIVGSGHALPTLGFIVQELALALAFRGAYKSLDGRDYLTPILTFIGMATATADEPAMAPSTGAEVAA